MANCTCNGRDAFGLASFDVKNDPTLRPGDIVSTKDGFCSPKRATVYLAATGIPFATTPMAKGVMSEANPLYLGMYAGEFSRPEVRSAVEGADLDLVPNVIQYPPRTRAASVDLSFFNLMMAATYFRRAARTRHPNVVRDIGREYLAKAGRVLTTHGS